MEQRKELQVIRVWPWNWEFLYKITFLLSWSQSAKSLKMEYLPCDWEVAAQTWLVLVLWSDGSLPYGLMGSSWLCSVSRLLQFKSNRAQQIRTDLHIWIKHTTNSLKPKLTVQHHVPAITSEMIITERKISFWQTLLKSSKTSNPQFLNLLFISSMFSSRRKSFTKSDLTVNTVSKILWATSRSLRTFKLWKD